jgi:hypothetical protein
MRKLEDSSWLARCVEMGGKPAMAMQASNQGGIEAAFASCDRVDCESETVDKLRACLFISPPEARDCEWGLACFDIDKRLLWHSCKLQPKLLPSSF